MKYYLNYFKQFVLSFTSIFTCIMLAATVFINIYSNPYLPVRLIVQAAIIALVASLLNFIYISEKPIYRKSMVIRTCIHFSLLLFTVTGCAWIFKWFSFTDPAPATAFFILFIAVYAIIWLANFIGDILDERMMNLRLTEYQSRKK